MAQLNLIDPASEVVVFGKRYPVAWPPPRSTVIRALVPTGRHVGHGNDLKVVHGPRNGGKKPGLERYSGGRHGGRAGRLLRVKG